MDLEQLVRVIEEIRERAAKYKELLVQNEAQTRVSLIDPLLRATGWPLEDPAVVQVEVRTNSGGKADYVLKWSDGRPAIVLEAKRVGGQLDLASSAAVGYAWELGRAGKWPKYIGLTDGLRWIIAEPHNLKSPVCQVDLGKTQQPIPEAVLQLVGVLWRRRWMDDGNKESAPSKSTLIPLSQLKPGKGEVAPHAVVFPDGTRREPRTKTGSTWKGLLLAVAEWLVSQGKLRPEIAPISNHPGSVTYIVNREPSNGSGKHWESKVQLSNGLWLHTFGPPVISTAWARRLCEAVGVDPAQILVER